MFEMEKNDRLKCLEDNLEAIDTGQLWHLERNLTLDMVIYLGSTDPLLHSPFQTFPHPSPTARNEIELHKPRKKFYEAVARS